MENVSNYEMKRSRLVTSVWSTVSRYGLAVSLVAVALLLALATYPIVSNAYVYLFLGAVVASAWLGRRGPGLFEALVAALTMDYFFLPPSHNLFIGREAWHLVLPFLAERPHNCMAERQAQARRRRECSFDLCC